MTSPLSLLMKSLLRLHIEPFQSLAWYPPADVYRSDREWLLKVELAGVRVEDIRLEASGHCLILRGVRRDQPLPHPHISYSMEIAYNRFERVFEFASAIDKADIRTEYRDGMLYIYLHTGGPT